MYFLDDLSGVKIFTTGAFLRSKKITDLSGKEIWVWIVDSFIEECYEDGEPIFPPTVAENLEDLICCQTVKETDDDANDY
jgi:hypothetical protein